MAYWVGYEDGRDAIESLYLDLDLSSITIPMAEAEPTDEAAALTEELVPTLIEVESATIEG